MMKPAVRYREIAHASPEYQAALRLRDEMLRRPLGMRLADEDLSDETEFTHIVGKDGDGVIVACMSLKPLAEGVLKMQQVAVSVHRQGEGIGRELVEFAEGLAKRAGADLIVLHAREAVIGFYEKLGYKRVGERFTEIGVPHFKAEKRLR